MDEPFSALDSLTRDELVEGLLANIDGTSVLISSHDLGEIESFASHIGYLERGRLQFSEELSTLVERFREVDVTLAHEPNLRAGGWPTSWMNVESAGALVRFVETRFEQGRTSAEVRRLFPNAEHIQIRAMPLRSIFITLAKASRKAAA